MPVPIAPADTSILASLPAEILGLILYWNVQMCRCDKNFVLPLRQVCKAFDTGLRPYLFKTVQLEFTRFLKDAERPKIEHLVPLGGLVDAIYLDMMVVRDEGMQDKTTTYIPRWS